MSDILGHVFGGVEIKGTVCGYEKPLAELIINACGRREGGYDKEGAQAAQAAGQLLYEAAKAAGDPNYYTAGLVDYKKFYRLSFAQCAALACRDNPAMTHIVYLLTAAVWNDALDWACETLGVRSNELGNVPYDAAEAATVKDVSIC
jgi:hypothetical protein